MLNYLTSGESHGPQVTAIIDGLPAGLPIDITQIDFQLSRRQEGYGRGGRMKIEQDRAKIVSGIRASIAMGGPITIVIENRDWPNWAPIMDPVLPIPENLDLRLERLANMTTVPRPGHADLTGGIKWGHHDMRNVLERASARETAARVAIGSLARQLLERFEIEIASHVVRIGGVESLVSAESLAIDTLRKRSEESLVRCLDPETSASMIKAIDLAKKKRDSLGGVVEIIVKGTPAGLGGFSQWFHRLDGKLAGALMAVHSVKGVEIGRGFAAAALRGSECQDEIYHSKKARPTAKQFYRKSNNAGGIEGGITNGEDIVLRVAAKPISTLNQPLNSIDVKTKKPAKAMVERTDNCAVPALGVVCEAVVALVIADVFLAKFGGDNIKEMERNYRSWLKASY